MIWLDGICLFRADAAAPVRPERMSLGKRTVADDVTAEACRLYCEAKRSKVLELSSMPEAELQLELERTARTVVLDVLTCTSRSSVD